MSKQPNLPPSIVPENMRMVEKSPMPPDSEQYESHFDETTGLWSTTVFPAKVPVSRTNVTRTEAWMDSKLEGLSFMERRDGLSSEEVFKQAQDIYQIAFREVLRQVMSVCIERGQLLQRIWAKYGALLGRYLELGEEQHQQMLENVRADYAKGLEAEFLRSNEKIDRMKHRFEGKKQKYHEKIRNLSDVQHRQRMDLEEHQQSGELCQATVMRLQTELSHSKKRFHVMKQYFRQKVEDRDSEILLLRSRNPTVTPAKSTAALSHSTSTIMGGSDREERRIAELRVMDHESYTRALKEMMKHEHFDEYEFVGSDVEEYTDEEYDSEIDAFDSDEEEEREEKKEEEEEKIEEKEEEEEEAPEPLAPPTALELVSMSEQEVAELDRMAESAREEQIKTLIKHIEVELKDVFDMTRKRLHKVPPELVFGSIGEETDGIGPTVLFKSLKPRVLAFVERRYHELATAELRSLNDKELTRFIEHVQKFCGESVPLLLSTEIVDETSNACVQTDPMIMEQPKTDQGHGAKNFDFKGMISALRSRKGLPHDSEMSPAGSRLTWRQAAAKALDAKRVESNMKRHLSWGNLVANTLENHVSERSSVRFSFRQNQPSITGIDAVGVTTECKEETVDSAIELVQRLQNERKINRPAKLSVSLPVRIQRLMMTTQPDENGLLIGRRMSRKRVRLLISQIYCEKMLADATATPHQTLLRFTYTFHIQKYALQRLAERHFVNLLVSLAHFKDRSPRIKLFGQFMLFPEDFDVDVCDFCLECLSTLKVRTPGLSASMADDGGVKMPTSLAAGVAAELVSKKITDAADNVGDAVSADIIKLANGKSKIDLDAAMLATVEFYRRHRSGSCDRLRSLFFGADRDGDGALDEDDLLAVLELVDPVTPAPEQVHKTFTELVDPEVPLVTFEPFKSISSVIAFTQSRLSAQPRGFDHPLDSDSLLRVLKEKFLWQKVEAELKELDSSDAADETPIIRERLERFRELMDSGDGMSAWFAFLMFLRRILGAVQRVWSLQSLGSAAVQCQLEKLSKLAVFM